MTRKFNRWHILMLLTAVFAVSIACGFYESGDESILNNEDRVYAMDPATVLDELKRGNMNVFTLVKATPEVSPKRPDITVFWSQEDYVQVIRTLQQAYWKDPMEGLVISSINFDLDCSKIEKGGFPSIIMNLNKIVKLKEEKRRIEYGYVIVPSVKKVITRRTEYGPNPYPPTELDLSHYKISAVAALQIAEKNGGAEKRLGVGNACTIYVGDFGNAGNNWNIRYYSTNDDPPKGLFEIAIDPMTGVFRMFGN